MIEALASAYRDPMLIPLGVVTPLLAALAFLAFALPLTYLAAKDPESLRRYRIQDRRPRLDLVVPSLKAWAVNNLAMLAVVLVSWPLLRHSGIHGGALPPWYVALSQLVFFVYLDDFLYYWAHRAMHTRWLFKKVHAWHHRVHTPWAITGNYMHPLELVMTGTVALAGPTIVSAHVAVVWAWMVFRQWEAAEGHSGYDFPFTPTHLFPLSDGPRHHDAHHAKVKGNYAGFFPWWDLLLGTASAGYAEGRKRRRGE